ncbi:MAG TPA: hypothetical protein DET40_23065 [Lentisphaeria bacterium]|nr:MAG: hypothetical protein A2X45_21235 [Lentisphaerae bacterium GWF2_50_93]HCE46435.1 hypothetical protein [Lentisphaeria bacterium]
MEYVYFGTYRNADARLLMDALLERDIRFDAEVDDSAIKSMSPIRMLLGGTFGTGSGIAIYVHPDDAEAADRIRKELFEPGA